MKAVIKIKYCKGNRLSFPAYTTEMVVKNKEHMSPTEAKKIAKEACEKSGNTFVDFSLDMQADWE